MRRDVMDLDSPPKPHLLKALASFTSDPEDRALLVLLASAAGSGASSGTANGGTKVRPSVVGTGKGHMRWRRSPLSSLNPQTNNRRPRPWRGSVGWRSSGCRWGSCWSRCRPASPRSRVSEWYPFVDAFVV